MSQYTTPEELRNELHTRFWSKVNRLPGGCWQWTASTTHSGHGQLAFDGNSYRVNRLSWEIHNGPIPKGLYVLHRCDNPACVNPDHLWLGTQSDNIRDRHRKGRDQRGSGHYNAKLTEKDVRKIRSRYDAGEAIKKLASDFDMGYSGIYYIVKRKSWKHVK